ncbi:hypothetical protein [Paraburkholderia sp. RL17-347-BIC-D]|uniref:hypothetical protein n=1 Tax=Paraburkholderia sp. RL17-347-BIC-D TaxID=3031632 RepID=UPI0038B6FE7E
MLISPKTLVGVIHDARYGANTIAHVRGLSTDRTERGYPSLHGWQAKLSPKHFGVGIFTAAQLIDAASRSTGLVCLASTHSLLSLHHLACHNGSAGI